MATNVYVDELAYTNRHRTHFICLKFLECVPEFGVCDGILMHRDDSSASFDNELFQNSFTELDVMDCTFLKFEDKPRH